MSFAALGSISFAVIASPTQMETTDGWHYAEFKLVEGKPTIQWIGDELRRIRFTLELHQLYADPLGDFSDLETMADQHQPVPFVFGSGENLGNFVIESIRRTDNWMADDGNPISLTAEIRLLEWAGPMSQGAPQQTSPTTTGVTGTTGPGATTTYSTGTALGQPTPTLTYQNEPISSITRQDPNTAGQQSVPPAGGLT